MTPEQIFALKFMGRPVNKNQIFKSLDGFSPTAKPKTIPITPLNLIKFEKFLTSARKYVDASRAKAHSFDFSQKTNLGHLAKDWFSQENLKTVKKAKKRVSDPNNMQVNKRSATLAAYRFAKLENNSKTKIDQQPSLQHQKTVIKRQNSTPPLSEDEGVDFDQSDEEIKVDSAKGSKRSKKPTRPSNISIPILGADFENIPEQQDSSLGTSVSSESGKSI